jgi:hypothetical protein
MISFILKVNESEPLKVYAFFGGFFIRLVFI